MVQSVVDPMAEESYQPVSIEAARTAAIDLEDKFRKSTKRRECPPIFLIFNFKRAPSRSSGPFRIRFSHPVRQFPFQAGIVFVKGETAPWTPLFEQTGINLKPVSLSMLKKKFTSQKAQDQLFKSADFFFCESAAAGALPGLLKSQFFSRNRQPMIVNLEQDPEQIAKEIRDATECAELYVKSDTRCFLRCGAFNVSFDQLAENIVHGIEEAMKLIPKAKARVESIALMTSGIEMQPFWRKHGKIVKVTPEMVKVEKNEEDDE